MSDIVNELRQTAGNLINGTIEDVEVSVDILTEAADEIERLRTALELARADLLKAAAFIHSELTFNSQEGSCE